MLETIYFLQDITGQDRKNEWRKTNKNVKRKEEDGRFRVGSQLCAHQADKDCMKCLHYSNWANMMKGN